MNPTIAVDLAKSVFEIAVSVEPGVVSERHRVSRAGFARFFVNRPAATVVMEACSSAHFWARRIQALGHRVVLLPPHHVRRYREHGRKTDRVDAKALLEAFRNEEILPVPVKSVEQHCLGALHRVRSGWMATRTARLNTLRGILRELGVVIPVGATQVVRQVRICMDDEAIIPLALRGILGELCEELGDLETRIKAAEHQLAAVTKQIPAAAHLRLIPGVGLLTSTALVGFVGDAKRFKSGRHFASYLGLTPRENSSGLTRRLGRISKKGDTYIRMLLIHGARSVLVTAPRQEKPTALAVWALKVAQRRGHNIATVALANKLARIIWATWSRGCTFDPTAHERNSAAA